MLCRFFNILRHFIYEQALTAGAGKTSVTGYNIKQPTPVRLRPPDGPSPSQEGNKSSPLLRGDLREYSSVKLLKITPLH